MWYMHIYSISLKLPAQMPTVSPASLIDACAELLHLILVSRAFPPAQGVYGESCSDKTRFSEHDL